MKAQHVDRNTLIQNPSRFLPFGAYWTFCALLFLWWVIDALTGHPYPADRLLRIQGYTIFLDGQWEVSTFIYLTMVS